jgi:hypothetical protein
MFSKRNLAWVGMTCCIGALLPLLVLHVPAPGVEHRWKFFGPFGAPGPDQHVPDPQWCAAVWAGLLWVRGLIPVSPFGAGLLAPVLVLWAEIIGTTGVVLFAGGLVLGNTDRAGGLPRTSLLMLGLGLCLAPVVITLVIDRVWLAAHDLPLWELSV